MRISDWSSDVCSSDLELPADPDAAFGVGVRRFSSYFRLHRYEDCRNSTLGEVALQFSGDLSRRREPRIAHGFVDTGPDLRRIGFKVLDPKPATGHVRVACIDTNPGALEREVEMDRGIRKRRIDRTEERRGRERGVQDGE